MMLMLEGIGPCSTVRRSSHITLAEGSNSCPVQVTRFLTRLPPRTNDKHQAKVY
jgi:hypothetical protein